MLFFTCCPLEWEWKTFGLALFSSCRWNLVLHCSLFNPEPQQVLQCWIRSGDPSVSGNDQLGQNHFVDRPRRIAGCSSQSTSFQLIYRPFASPKVCDSFIADFNREVGKPRPHSLLPYLSEAFSGRIY